MRELAERLAPGRGVRVIAGGATRQESSRNGVAAVTRANAVLVHDGARPLVRAEDVRSAMREVRAGRGAVLATPVVDTIKVVDAATMTVRRTLDREPLWAAQTPQLALVNDLRRAHAEAHKNGVEATDDVALLEALGFDVAIVPATGENFKVTRPEDLQRADTVLRKRAESARHGEDVLFVEVFADDALADAIARELESRGATIDGIDRDLPRGIAVRAFISAERFHGFTERFEAFGDGTATCTARFAHA
jgi:2-C-methyl-D-erythritol 4-phosphate cytidylyltransferase